MYDKSVQLIALPASAVDPQSIATPIIVLAPPGTDPDEAVWARLQQEALPLLPEWREPILAELKRGRLGLQLTQLSSLAAPGQPDPVLWHLQGFSEEAWERFIRRLLASQRIVLSDGKGPNGPLPDAHMTQDQYLVGWAAALGEKLESVVVPRVKAGSGAPASWSVLKRPPHARPGGRDSCHSRDVPGAQNRLSDRRARYG